MNVQTSHKLTTFAAVLLATFAFPAAMCAQAVPTTTTQAKKPAAVPVKPAAQPKAVVPPVKQPAPVAKVATSTVQQTTQQVTKAAPVQPSTVRAANASTTASTGTLTWGNVIYTPAGCVHNGTKAVCTFTLMNQGNAVTLQAPWQMNTLQFVDDAHVPHFADAAYFIDNYGTRQAQLFVNNGQGGTLVREFPNVNDQVASGEFHLANQVIGGISVAAPGTIGGQGAPPVANTPVQAVQPVTPNSPVTTTAADPTSQVQSGINQVNDKKQKAKSIWNQIKTIKK